MTCNHNCNQGRNCNCPGRGEQGRADKTLYLILAFISVLFGFIVWSLI